MEFLNFELSVFLRKKALRARNPILSPIPTTLQMAQQNQDITLWFEKEIKSHDRKLRHFLRKKTSAPSDVEDIVQESYRRIIEVKNKQHVRSPKGLLFKIAKNINNDHLRRKYRTNTFFVAEMDDIGDFASAQETIEAIEKGDQMKMLESALLTLPPKCRSIMILRNYNNLSYKQIAAELNISVDTVETQLSRGLKRLRKYFKRNGYTM